MNSLEGTLDRCLDCKYAEWDYEDGFYGTNLKQWFIIGCSCETEPNIDGDECGQFIERDVEWRWD